MHVCDGLTLHSEDGVGDLTCWWEGWNADTSPAHILPCMGCGQRLEACSDVGDPPSGHGLTDCRVASAGEGGVVWSQPLEECGELQALYDSGTAGQAQRLSSHA